jgi:pimeloyl-ACP methyl ester carboxylesterase
MSLVYKTRVSILKNFFVSFLLAVLLNSFFISVAFAQNFMVSSGTDNTTEISAPLSPSDITKINESDDSRFQNNSTTWPIGESYDESKYIEFIFAPNIPENAIINEVYLTHEFRRSGALSGAKLEIWDGDVFHDEILTVGSINTDHTDITPILAYLDTPTKINNLKVRFLAYRGEGGQTKTSHDFLELSVTYNIPTPVDYTEIHGNISDSTVWTKDNNPYVVSEEIYIMNGATLTIEPGVVVKFKEWARLTVDTDSAIRAIGNKDDPIYFTSFYDDEILGDTNGDGNLTSPIFEQENTWDGINFIGDSFSPLDRSVLKNIIVQYSWCGISMRNVLDIKISDSIFKKNYSGICDGGQVNVEILNTKIINNHIGININQDNIKPNSVYTIQGLSIYDNTEYGLRNTSYKAPVLSKNFNNPIFWFTNLFKIQRAYAETLYDYTVDFRNTWWGDISGPYHPILNPEGLGDPISDNIIFDPWRLAEDDSCLSNCFSNVMFFPGVQGSRIYGDITGCDVVIPVACSEQQLWVSNNKILQEYMFLDEYGKSLNNIYTKNDTEALETDEGETGIVDSVLSLDLYDSFILDLKNLKDTKAINDYAFIPYDWRLSLGDIITNGKVIGENLSYIENQDFSESFILNKLRELEKSSKSGKVTLIAHSTGGLVIKALVQKLKDTNDPLYEKIDKIIFVAVPQVGTPEATIAMLHGIPLGYGILMPSERSRELGENMPTMYNLAPSSAFFDTVNANLSPIITFPDHELFENQIAKYGNSINTFQELRDFVLGGDGRVKPEVKDTDKPNIVNEYLYTQAENIHEIIDDWQPSANTKIIEVAGWGEETKAGLKYVVKKKFFGLGGEYISYKPIKVIDGDSTVVLPSALWMENNENVEEWFVNLEEYNSENSPDRNHKNILEIKNVRDFINAKIKNIFSFSDSENIVVNNRSTLISEGKRLHFTLHSPLTLGITSSEGRYTGLDPETGEIKEEIPDVTYEQIGEVQFLSIPEGVEYTLKLDGYEEGSFTLDLEEQEGNDITAENYFETIPTSSKTLAYLEIGTDFKVPEAKLKIDADGDGDIDEVYPKVEEVIEEIKPVASPHGAVILPKNDNIIPSKTLAFLENIGQVLGVETKEVVTQEIKEPENNQEKVFIEKENSQNIEVESTPEEENKEEAPIDILKEKDTNKNTSFYVIILSILALSFIIKRFILI